MAQVHVPEPSGSSLNTKNFDSEMMDMRAALGATTARLQTHELLMEQELAKLLDKAEQVAAIAAS